MPRLLDGQTRTDEIVRGLCRVVISDGIAALSTRKIAGQVGISIGTLAHHFESREWLIRACVHVFAKGFVEKTRSRIAGEGLAAFLPESTDERAATRVWLAFQEMGRTAPDIGPIVADARGHECWLLATSGTPRLDTRRAAAAYAMLEGLRNAICATSEPMPLELAHVLLEDSVGRLRAAA